MDSLPGYVWSAVHDAPTHEIFPGIRVRPLWSDGNGAKAQLLEMDPHTCWEGVDVHEPGPEEVFVVSGVFNDGQQDYPAGSFIHAPMRLLAHPPDDVGLHALRLLPRRLSAGGPECRNAGVLAAAGQGSLSRRSMCSSPHSPSGISAATSERPKSVS